MDKYTVDLDQVLNDFEYLELTDTQSRNIPDQPQNSNAVSSPNVAKHSINNVFHSLNEYLNTNISKEDVCKAASNSNKVDIKTQELNNISDLSCESEKNKPVTELILDYRNIHSEATEETKRENNEGSLKTEEEICNSSIPVLKSDNFVQCTDKIDQNKHNVDNNEAESLQEYVNISNNDHSHNNLAHSTDMKPLLSEDKVILQSSVDNVVNAIDNFCDSNIEKSLEKNDISDTKIEVNSNIDSSGNLTKIDNINIKDVEDFVIEPSNNIEGHFEVNSGDSLNLEDSNSYPMKIDITSENEPLVDTTNIDTNISDKQSNDSIIENIVEEKHLTDTESNIHRAELENTAPIGFSSNIDIDEKDLSELLDNFELELGEVPPQLEVIKSEEEICEVKQNSALTNDIVNNPVNVVKEGIIEEANNVTKDAEVLEMERNMKSDLTNETKSCNNYNPTEEVLTLNAEKVDEDNQEFDEEVSAINGKYDKIVVEEKLATVDIDPPLESVSRPQELCLNKDMVEEKNTARKIDLIGSPGSTPYNNVYINQSIQPKESQDSDSDNSSSASPTCSECSVDSTTTASTVSLDNGNREMDDIKSTENVNSNDNAKTISEDNTVTQLEPEVTEPSNTEATVLDESDDSPKPAVSDTNPSNDTGEAGAGDVKPSGFLDKSWLGKEAPLWIPDSVAVACLHCDMKFTVLKRRHHCRACGLVLCSKCCNLKFRLAYLNAEARVCNKCFDILNKDSSSSVHTTPAGENQPTVRPNPNNPLEYCSTVSPLQQVGQAGTVPPSVMVPVGVLKRKGSNKKSNKSVMFCDGIAPGSDLTNLDQDFNYSAEVKVDKPAEDPVKKKEKVPNTVANLKTTRNQPKVDHETGCYIPKSETNLPPTITINKSDVLYSECTNSPSVVEMLKNETLLFAINQNLFVHVKIIDMSCCINKHAWCFSTEGLINVGSDEIIYLLEYIEDESFVPKDLFFHIHTIYVDAVNGSSLKELGMSLHNTSTFLNSRNHAGFVYIRPSFQCLENVIIPKESYLIGILFHRWETPWAKLFPLRLILRLGAEYRYYPSPIISTRYRESVFVEIGHTIINILADFRNFTYTLPEIRGLIIHMEEKKTSIMIPKNRYDQIIKSINNSSDHILALAGNFSPEADSHLVCIQDTVGNENSYTTHAINIHNKPRKVTGASFVVFNGSLRSSSGLTAKSTIVEDGLMIQISSEHMEKLRDNLRNLKDHTIACGYINAASDETVNIIWGENDSDFNVGVKSPVDLTDLKGVPSIRVHNGKDYFCNNGTKLIRWTEVFIVQNGEENSKNQEPVDVSKISECVAKACCNALVKYLDLLVSNSCQKIGIRTTLHVENVSYSAGSNGLKLPPIYMRSLDNELIPVLHRITTNSLGDNIVVLELIFRILNS